MWLSHGGICGNRDLESKAPQPADFHTWRDNSGRIERKGKTGACSAVWDLKQTALWVSSNPTSAGLKSFSVGANLQARKSDSVFLVCVSASVAASMHKTSQRDTGILV